MFRLVSIAIVLIAWLPAYGQPPVVVVEVNAVLPPVVTTGQELELTPVQWMKGMSNPETSRRFIAIGCI